MARKEGTVFSGGLAIADAYRRQGANVVVIGGDADNPATAGERFGQVDVLVANAGGINFTPLGQTSEEDFDTASDLNFKAVFFTVQAALAHLADGASVIVTGNAFASTAVVGPSVAIAAKAAVRSLARTFAVELAPRGIRGNVLSPGPTTAAPDEMPHDMSTQITRQIPLGRWAVLKTSRRPQSFSRAKTPPMSQEPTSTLAEASAWAGFPQQLGSARTPRQPSARWIEPGADGVARA